MRSCRDTDAGGTMRLVTLRHTTARNAPPDRAWGVSGFLAKEGVRATQEVLLQGTEALRLSSSPRSELTWHGKWRFGQARCVVYSLSKVCIGIRQGGSGWGGGVQHPLPASNNQRSVQGYGGNNAEVEPQQVLRRRSWAVILPLKSRVLAYALKTPGRKQTNLDTLLTPSTSAQIEHVNAAGCRCYRFFCARTASAASRACPTCCATAPTADKQSNACMRLAWWN